jgi:adenylosuccinate lyase
MSHPEILALPDPLIGRYLKGELAQQASLLSDQHLYVHHCVKVELALLRALARRDLLEMADVDQAERDLLGKLDPMEIVEEENRVRHDLKAVVNVMARHSSEKVAPYIHLGATSYDILSNAHLMRLREGVEVVVLPRLRNVLKQLVRLSREHAETSCIGRTHGQYAEPTTFGYTMACFCERLGLSIQEIERSLGQLRGKFSGAVGAYVAMGLIFDDPRLIEEEILAEVGLLPHQTSTQITHPEPALAVLHHLTAAFGVLANMADDLRHLQRSEIAEVAEAFDAKNQVGSSAMPHKRNPITWENVKSLWKTFLPNIFTYYMDQISEHQRDLTNSASARFQPRLLLGLAVAADRSAKGLEKLFVDAEAMKRRLDSLDQVVSGPAQVLLASVGYVEAHERVRQLTLEEGHLCQHLESDSQVAPFWAKLSERQKDALKTPSGLTGPASKQALETAARWDQCLQSAQREVHCVS